MQSEMAGTGTTESLAEITRDGIGHYTRVYGTRPVDPDERAAWLWQEQRRLKRETRLGIPALVHEECLTGLAAWKAATFPTPLAWGAAADPELVEEVGRVIGESMRLLGVHQGLAPVLDVVRDPRWGRVDECIAEDPYLVGTVGTAYVRGLQAAGVHATLKHFLGYSASRAGRNHAPVSAGPREVADVFLPPFEMAIRDGGARSVMNSYAEIDGVPMASSEEWLTDVLRGDLGFDGVVVADYFAVAFLDVMHRIAADRGEAAALALRAGVDVELPSGDAYLRPLAERVRRGEFDERYVDRAVLRALAQKEELGLLDPAAFEDDPPTGIDLDSPRHRALARRLAEESLVLLRNDGVLPLGGAPARIAVVGPNADRAEALQGCYSFANHVLAAHPGLPLGFAIPTVLEALPGALVDAGLGAPELVFAEGCSVEGPDDSGIAPAVTAATGADVVIVVVGDQAGLFGRGTVGEGNDSDSLELPGVQRRLVEALVATGTPVVMVLLTGRPYALGWALDDPATAPAAVLQAFFPGEGGGLAIADAIVGRVNPSGHLPVSVPAREGGQPWTYLGAKLSYPSEVSNIDTTPADAFGTGLSYSTFSWGDFRIDGDAASSAETATMSVDGQITVGATVHNDSGVDGTELVQLYVHDPIASVTRPLTKLIGFARVPVSAGETVSVQFDVPADVFSFTGRDGVRIVEPGAIQLHLGRSSSDTAHTFSVLLTGPVRPVDHTRQLHCVVTTS